MTDSKKEKKRSGTNGIKTKYFQKKKILPLPLILLKAQTPPPSKITTSNTFINTVPSHRHHPPTFLITRSNTLPKQRWRKKFGLDIVSHNSPLPPPRPGETRIHRDKTNPCPDKWRLAGTVLKGREFETTINPGQRLINGGRSTLARRAR